MGRRIVHSLSCCVVQRKVNRIVLRDEEIRARREALFKRNKAARVARIARRREQAAKLKEEERAHEEALAKAAADAAVAATVGVEKRTPGHSSESANQGRDSGDAAGDWSDDEAGLDHGEIHSDAGDDPGAQGSLKGVVRVVPVVVHNIELSPVFERLRKQKRGAQLRVEMQLNPGPTAPCCNHWTSVDAEGAAVWSKRSVVGAGSYVFETDGSAPPTLTLKVHAGSKTDAEGGVIEDEVVAWGVFDLSKVLSRSIKRPTVWVPLRFSSSSFPWADSEIPGLGADILSTAALQIAVGFTPSCATTDASKGVNPPQRAEEKGQEDWPGPARDDASVGVGSTHGSPEVEAYTEFPEWWQSAPITFDQCGWPMMTYCEGVMQCSAALVQVREKVAPYSFLVGVVIPEASISAFRVLVSAELRPLLPSSPTDRRAGVCTAPLRPQDLQAEVAIRGWKATGVSPTREAVMLWLLRRCVVVVSPLGGASILLQVRLPTTTAAAACSQRLFLTCFLCWLLPV